MTKTFEPLPAWNGLDEARLMRLDDEAFRVAAHGSAVQRAGREGLARNAALVLGNRGDRSAAPALASAASDDPSLTVREAASWALDKLRAVRPAE